MLIKALHFLSDDPILKNKQRGTGEEGRCLDVQLHESCSAEDKPCSLNWSHLVESSVFIWRRLLPSSCTPSSAGQTSCSPLHAAWSWGYICQTRRKGSRTCRSIKHFKLNSSHVKPATHKGASAHSLEKYNLFDWSQSVPVFVLWPWSANPTSQLLNTNKM